MRAGLRNAILGLTACAATTISGSGARAETLLLSLLGSCADQCDAGVNLTGVIALDLNLVPNAPITSVDLMAIRVGVDGVDSPQLDFRFATGNWSASPGDLGSLSVSAGSSVSPLFGTVTSAAISRGLDGSITGSLSYFVGAACSTASCASFELAPDALGSTFDITATPLVTSPVPLPPAAGLLFGSLALLAAANRIRRRDA